jgi:hypothetical protein
VAADYVTAGVGLVGALIGALGAWGAAIVVERRRENLQVLGALEMLIVEVGENADRLPVDKNAGGLTLGIWEHSKPVLAGPGRRAVTDELWKELHGAYRKIYEAKRLAISDDDGSFRCQLEGLSGRLAETVVGFEAEIKKWRYWLRPENSLLRPQAIQEAGLPGKPDDSPPGEGLNDRPAAGR